MRNTAVALIFLLTAVARGPVFAQDAGFPTLDDIRNNSKKVLDTIRSAPPAVDLSDFNFNFKNLNDYARQHARPFYWKELLHGFDPVIYIGETHPIASIKTELAAHMHEIKEAGITHIAFEMLGDDKQALADKYCHDGSCRVDLHDALKGPEWGWAPDSYMQVMAAAQKEGLKILLIDLPGARQEEIRKRNSDSNDQFKAENAVDDARDSRMAANINAGLLDDPDARILVLAGGYHAAAGTQPRLLKDIYRRRSRSYIFVCGKKTAYREIVSVNFKRQRILIPLPREIANYDGVIGIPEVVKECDAN